MQVTLAPVASVAGSAGVQVSGERPVIGSETDTLCRLTAPVFVAVIV